LNHSAQLRVVAAASPIHKDRVSFAAWAALRSFRVEEKRLVKGTFAALVWGVFTVGAFYAEAEEYHLRALRLSQCQPPAPALDSSRNARLLAGCPAPKVVASVKQPPRRLIRSDDHALRRVWHRH
jgi:hypothetical protein